MEVNLHFVSIGYSLKPITYSRLYYVFINQKIFSYGIQNHPRKAWKLFGLWGEPVKNLLRNSKCCSSLYSSQLLFHVCQKLLLHQLPNYPEILRWLRHLLSYRNSYLLANRELANFGSNVQLRKQASSKLEVAFVWREKLKLHASSFQGNMLSVSLVIGQRRGSDINVNVSTFEWWNWNSVRWRWVAVRILRLFWVGHCDQPAKCWWESFSKHNIKRCLILTISDSGRAALQKSTNFYLRKIKYPVTACMQVNFPVEKFEYLKAYSFRLGKTRTDIGTCSRDITKITRDQGQTKPCRLWKFSPEHWLRTSITEVKSKNLM